MYKGFCTITQWTEPKGNRRIGWYQMQWGGREEEGAKREELEEDDLHPPFSESIHDGLVSQHELEELLPPFGHIEQRALLGVEVGDIEDEVREMIEGERVCASVSRIQSLRADARGERNAPDSLKSLPIRPGVPTAIPTLVFCRYSMCSWSLKCFEKSLATSISLVLYGLTSLRAIPLVSLVPGARKEREKRTGRGLRREELRLR